jgi:hypothetical protein
MDLKSWESKAGLGRGLGRGLGLALTASAR